MAVTFPAWWSEEVRKRTDVAEHRGRDDRPLLGGHIGGPACCPSTGFPPMSKHSKCFSMTAKRFFAFIEWAANPIWSNRTYSPGAICCYQRIPQHIVEHYGVSAMGAIRLPKTPATWLCLTEQRSR